MPEGDGFHLILQYPAATDHTGRTMEFVLRNKKTAKRFTYDGPATYIVVTDENIALSIPPAAVSAEDAGITLADVQGKTTEFKIDVLESDGTLYTRIQGDVVWVDELGDF